MSNTPALVNKREGFFLKPFWLLCHLGKLHTPSSSLRTVSPATWHITDSQGLGQRNRSHNELCQRLGNCTWVMFRWLTKFSADGLSKCWPAQFQQGICYVYTVTWIKLQPMDLKWSLSYVRKHDPVIIYPSNQSLLQRVVLLCSECSSIDHDNVKWKCLIAPAAPSFPISGCDFSCGWCQIHQDSPLSNVYWKVIYGLPT